MRSPFAPKRTEWKETAINWERLHDYLSGRSRDVSGINWPRSFMTDNYERDNLWVIYTLRKPGGQVRYVGITKGNPAIRFRAHAHGGSSAKRDWFNAQPAPVMEIVSSIRGSQAMAVAAEVTLTRYYAERGHRMLNREACYV